MKQHPITHRPLNRPPTKAESILEVPDTHITPEYRAELLRRAEAGEDVYAYGSVDSPTGIINVWDIDTRIPLFPLAQWRWGLDTFSQGAGDRRFDWFLQFKAYSDPQVRRIVISLVRSPFENRAPYEDFSARRIRMVANYINLYGDDPQAYNGKNF